MKRDIKWVWILCVFVLASITSMIFTTFYSELTIFGSILIYSVGFLLIVFGAVLIIRKCNSNRTRTLLIVMFSVIFFIGFVMSIVGYKMLII